MRPRLEARGNSTTPSILLWGTLFALSFNGEGDNTVFNLGFYNLGF